MSAMACGATSTIGRPAFKKYAYKSNVTLARPVAVFTSPAHDRCETMTLADVCTTNLCSMPTALKQESWIRLWNATKSERHKRRGQDEGFRRVQALQQAAHRHHL